jgi:hypothetical protein
MGRTRTWTVEIRIIEHEDEGRTPTAETLRWQPSDQDPRVGDDPATARAFADLANKALDVAAADIGRFTHHSMRLLS